MEGAQDLVGKAQELASGSAGTLALYILLVVGIAILLACRKLVPLLAKLLLTKILIAEEVLKSFPIFTRWMTEDAVNRDAQSAAQHKLLQDIHRAVVPQIIRPTGMDPAGAPG